MLNMKKSLKTKDGLSIFYKYNPPKDKKKPVLFYVHGLGGNWSLWKESIKEARKSGFGALALDLRGHGLSSFPEEYEQYKLETLAKDLRDIVLKEKIKNYVFLGHSLGGSIMIVYCMVYKTFLPKALVFVEATHRYPYKKYHELNSNPVLCYSLRKLVDWKILNNKNLPKLPELDLFSITSENVFYQVFDELYHTSMKTIFFCLDAAKEFSDNRLKDVNKALSVLPIPTLIIAGKKDTVISSKFSKELNKLMPNSKLKIFKEGTHHLPLEHPQLLNTEVFSFLSNIKF